jgi:phage-related protein
LAIDVTKSARWKHQSRSFFLGKNPPGQSKSKENMANVSSAIENLMSAIISVVTSFFYLILSIFHAALDLSRQALWIIIRVGSSAFTAFVGLFSSVAAFVFGQ